MAGLPIKRLLKYREKSVNKYIILPTVFKLTLPTHYKMGLNLILYAAIYHSYFSIIPLPFIRNWPSYYPLANARGKGPRQKASLSLLNQSIRSNREKGIYQPILLSLIYPLPLCNAGAAGRG